MRKIDILMMLAALGTLGINAEAAKVSIKMNSTSKIMTLTSKTTGEKVETGPISDSEYSFDAPAGLYVLTAYGSDGKTVNGSIDLTVTDTPEIQQFTLLTCTIYADNPGWSLENGDYTIDATVNTREGVNLNSETGASNSSGKYSLLAFAGNSYEVEFIPSETHRSEGYGTLYKTGTLTADITINGKIPMCGEYTITIPSEAELEIGLKKAHFIDFKRVAPTSTATKGDYKEVTFNLAQGQVYTYRTWMAGGLTQAGYFTYAADETKRPKLHFTKNDYEAFAPETIIHDVMHNQGYETGNIFVNVNERGYLKLKAGETFKAHAMRTWELTDNATSNNFFEPDFNYTVIGLDGTPDNKVLEISSRPGSAWADIKAKADGTVIVLVTYDAIGVNYYKDTTKTPILGGEYWSAIWPENTAAYVVSVGEGESTVIPNMLINESYNTDALKMAGKYVDAEHDIFYYLDTEAGASYRFKPDNAVSVTMAYAHIGDRMATYKGFSSEGVTKNEDGSYTLLLKEGRQIVCMTDANGNSTYQVLTAKPCHREITNVSNPGSNIIQPGDEIKIQYSGLFHPANKLAGIYNMSAYVTYNGKPNGSDLILGSGQYTFGSAPAAQAVTVTIPTEHDTETAPTIEMTEGVIQVNGYGDPIGNHRNIDPVAGRSPNFTAIAHKTYFGMIPDVSIPVSAYRTFAIKVESNVPNAEISLTYRDKILKADESTGLYSGSYGTYDIEAKAEGYRCLRTSLTIADDAEGEQTFALELKPLDGAWDGKTKTEPAIAEGIYQISNGAELAWYAEQVNSGKPQDAIVVADISLGGFDWTPIGTSSKPFSANFDGNGHTISDLYINTPKTSYQGLFGYMKGVSAEKPATVSGICVSGKVTAKQHSAGVVGFTHQHSKIERCVNNADVTGSNTYIGGVVGNLNQLTASVHNCYNTGKIVGTTNCGGVVGGHVAKATIENVFNTGEISGKKVAGCAGGTTSKENCQYMYTTGTHDITDAHITVTSEQMKSGEVAYLLGDAFGQSIGEDLHPVLAGAKVYKVEYMIAETENENSLNDADEMPVLYTNGVLPAKLDGKDVTWYSDEAMTQPVTTVDTDAMLYAKVKNDNSGVTEIESQSEERWFNLQGVEVTQPAEGVHGIFIHIVNGKSVKVIR